MTVQRADAGAAFWYGGAVVTAITRWKFERALGVGTALSGLFAAEMRGFVTPDDVLAPVPLHPRRLAERGFNPAQLLARALGRHTGARVLPHLLRRVRDTPKQSRLGRDERARNMAHAFVVTTKVPPGARIVLIDDVRTTGSTLRACHAALSAHGAASVDAAVLAQAPPTG